MAQAAPEFPGPTGYEYQSMRQAPTDRASVRAARRMRPLLRNDGARSCECLHRSLGSGTLHSTTPCLKHPILWQPRNRFFVPLRL
jgi:hypothetical protein